MFEFEYFKSYEDAYKREAELVTDKECDNPLYYNQRLVGKISRLGNKASEKAVKQRFNNVDGRKNDHNPSHFSSDNNPMKKTELKQKMIKSQRLKPVKVEGVDYFGVREAARQLGMNRKTLLNRLKSPNFPDYVFT